MFRTMACAAALMCSNFIGAQAADLQNDMPASASAFSDGLGGEWVVTVGALVGSTPLFPGSKTETLTAFPVIDIHRPGAIEWLSLPTDAFSITLYNTENFRIGAAGDFLLDRNSKDTSDVKGLASINYTAELGAFAEYYPTPYLRARAELLQGVTGADGLEARLKADFIYRPVPQWIFTAGPRLQFVNTQYASTFFSVTNSESSLSGLPVFHASGGVGSAGVDATARYYVSDNLSLRAFVDWERLTGDPGDSPIVKYRGSEDQVSFGVGAAIRFNYPLSSFKD